MRHILLAGLVTISSSFGLPTQAGGAGGFAVLSIPADTAAVAEIPDDGPAVAEIPAPTPRPAVVRVAPAQPPRSAPSVRQQLDPNDNVERVLILAPGGPIVLQATVFIDGQPFRQLREKLVEELLKHADLDGDGTPTWDEALRNPRFASGRYYQYARLNATQREGFVKRLDQNGDGVADRYEARAIFAQLMGGSGSEFQVPSNASIAMQPNIRDVLDLDKDGTISADELAAAPERLKSRDANDNDLLEISEVSGGGSGAYARQVAFRGGQTMANSSAFPLGTNVNYAAIRAALRQRYRLSDDKLTAKSFPLFPRLLDGLDRNANDELDEAEIPLFNTIRPHIAITVHLGQKEGSKPGVQITWLCDEFLSRDGVKGAALERVGASLPGVKLLIAAAGSTSLGYNYRQAAQSMLMQYDKDQNGYIEKKEFDGQQNKEALLYQFEAWDDNGDGKVYADEIEASYERQLAPQRSQVTLAAGERGPSLFGSLDQSGDSRLSLREIRTAAERLKSFDADGDGRLSNAEIPTEIVITLSQGPSTPYYAGAGIPLSPATGAVGGPASPKWFQSMDRNGDGDLTPREFLGTAEQFRDLDKNGDGFIEPLEARDAKPSASR